MPASHLLNRASLVRAVPFNMVWGRGVTTKKLGWEGEGCRLEIILRKTMGGGGVSSEI